VPEVMVVRRAQHSCDRVRTAVLVTDQQFPLLQLTVNKTYLLLICCDGCGIHVKMLT
jgi:hypothetical protein